MQSAKKTLPKTWAGFCKLTGRNPKALPDVSAYDERDQKHAIADFKLTLIIRYCNGKDPDYTDGSTKYEPRFWIQPDKKSPSGFGLSSYGYDDWLTNTCVGPRLTYLSYDDMRHVVKYFIKEYTDLIL